MKLSESWLREWVNPPLMREALGNLLTMSGLEVEEIVPAAENFSNVVVGQILQVEKHAQSEQLHVCTVDVGSGKILSIVCADPHVAKDLKTPVALIGAHLPNKGDIQETSIQGIKSQGMLCSAADLGLAEESTGIMLLPYDAPLGKDVFAYLHLPDHILDVAINPNRGDCLSIRGLAREVAALSQTPLTPLKVESVAPAHNESFPVQVTEPAACPHYVGRVIRAVNRNAMTPVWMQERLRRAGVRSISPIVNVTNYVMLELGQPMHAFDLGKLKHHIEVRHSRPGEKIVLLDDSEKELDDQTLIIADSEKPLAIAGVMGGLDSAVTAHTQDIFLESAFFSPQVVARQRQFYGLHSESAYRFERGVDPTQQAEAIERATALILTIAGGQPGPLVEVANQGTKPSKVTIILRESVLNEILGMTIANDKVEATLKALHLSFKRENNAWQVEVPAYRFDLRIEEDLIEEIARLQGYDTIPTTPVMAGLRVKEQLVEEPVSELLRTAFQNHGYHEIVTYSFVDKTMQGLLDPLHKPHELQNPMTSEMSVMRTNLWPGLINTLLYNKSRQQQRVRLFESGVCFYSEGLDLMQQPRMAGLLAGEAYPLQWGLPAREVDFYDLKGDLESILRPLLGEGLSFKPAGHPALHPGQTAALYRHDRQVGIVGALHPYVCQTLDITGGVYVFELQLEFLSRHAVPQSQEIGKFPEIRRDISLLVNQTVPVEAIQDTISQIVGNWLKEVFVFDLYQGKGVPLGKKSIALALILQHPSRTLVDEEVNAMMDGLIAALKGQLGADLRS